MKTISIHELNKCHLEHYDCFIPVFENNTLDRLILDCQLAEPRAFLEVIVPEDGEPGIMMLAEKIKAFGFTYSSFFPDELKLLH